MDKILIVEDDRFFRDMFSGLLKSQGYDVDCAADGAEGLEMISANQYGLVITDLVMPDISGMEILSKVKEKDSTIDVIMVTGNANMESAIYALKHGVHDYLVKPVNSDEFLHSVAQCLEKRRILDENEELKNMLNLFQTSQNISGCLDLERICHLTLEAIVREIGVSRGIGLFVTENGLELKDVKGLSNPVAFILHNMILPFLGKDLKKSKAVQKIVFAKQQDSEVEVSQSGVNQAYLVFVRNKGALIGLVAAFNDVDADLPDFEPKSKNVMFLLEQSVRAFDNAQKFNHAKDMLFVDDLSGMYNNRYLEVVLERELKRVERYTSHLAIIFLDLDCFKLVNDTHGHLVGSKVLKEMGALLKKSVRDVDVVIRYGGDEYTIVLVETRPEEALVVAERIRKRVEANNFLASEGYSIRLTCSIGYSCCPEDTVSKNDLLEMADKAMYVGKSKGKNCVNRFLRTS